MLQRFYFVSDPTLLEILSLGSDPPSVVPHFQSGLFDSLTAVTFDKVDKGKMLDMFSQQGEKVEFEKPVEAKGEQPAACRVVDKSIRCCRFTKLVSLSSISHTLLNQTLLNHAATSAQHLCCGIYKHNRIKPAENAMQL